MNSYGLLNALRGSQHEQDLRETTHAGMDGEAGGHVPLVGVEPARAGFPAQEQDRELLLAGTADRHHHRRPEPDAGG